MADTVYVLCALASLVCAVRLRCAWQSTREPLLFWSALCFAGLALNNALLVADLVILPTVDLAILRASVGLASLSALVYGLAWHVGSRE